MSENQFRLNGAKAARSAKNSSTPIRVYGKASSYTNTSTISGVLAAMVANNKGSSTTTTVGIAPGTVFYEPGGTSATVTVAGSPSKYTKDDPGDTGETARYNDLNTGKYNGLNSNTTVVLPPARPQEYKWNLPPHRWSLPLEAPIVNSEHYKKNNFNPRGRSHDQYRRGRIWWKANPKISTVDRNGKQVRISEGEENRKYGFQFLWNPETISTQVSVQLDATPSVQDRFLGVSGAFPATQTISFNVRLDRTNDFACAQAAFSNQLQNIVRTENVTSNVLFAGAINNGGDRDQVIKRAPLDNEVAQFIKFYRPPNSFANSDSDLTAARKLIDLFQRGTIADIEYLYRAINGPGPGGASKNEWLNGRGIKTADIGFLMPTLLHVDIGPLSYDGYVTALQVTHLAFTPNMTPIRSDLTISLNVLATSSLTTYDSGSTSGTSGVKGANGGIKDN